MNSSIKTLSQTHSELVQKKRSIIATISSMDIAYLPKEQDPQEKHITMEKIFQKIPSDSQLSVYSSNSTYESRENRLINYRGPYELVKRAASKIETLKSEASEIYSLFTQLDLPKETSEEFKELKNEAGLCKLRSLQIAEDKQLKTVKFERNTLSEEYVFGIRREFDEEEILHPNQYLGQNDMLIHICVYDAVNRQKQNEFVFLGDMKLSDLKDSIYCMIETISAKRRSSQQKDSAQSVQYRKGKNSSNDESSFFLFEDSLYYQSGRSSGSTVGGSFNSQANEIESLVQKLQVMHKKKYHKYPMSQTQLKNLRVVFGRNYLFRHLGGCDHMIVFKDLRLYQDREQIDEPINIYDCSIKKKYPICIFENKMKRKRCEGCELKFSSMAFMGDMAKNGETSYLCQECHQNLHNSLSEDKNSLMREIPYLHE